MKEVKLKCSVSKGMFPGEAGVSFAAANGDSVSLFCTTKYVDKQHEVLTVKLLEQSKDFAHVRLPAESLSGSRIEIVKLDQIMGLK